MTPKIRKNNNKMITKKMKIENESTLREIERDRDRHNGKHFAQIFVSLNK